MTASDPANWPDGVERIGLEDLGRLGINASDQLFWDGRRIEVRQSLALSNVQKLVAGTVTVCAILGAIGGFVTGFNNASVFLCAREIHWLSCPAAPVEPAKLSAPPQAPDNQPQP